MRGVVPWKNVDEAIVVLTERRDVSSRQIDALRRNTTSPKRDVLLLLQYVGLASMLRVADWANEQGWRLPGSEGTVRVYTQNDIRALIQNPPLEAGPDLCALANEIFVMNSKAVKKRFW